MTRTYNEMKIKPNKPSNNYKKVCIVIKFYIYKQLIDKCDTMC